MNEMIVDPVEPTKLKTEMQPSALIIIFDRYC